MAGKAGRPKGEPTKVIRVYEVEADKLARLGERLGKSVPEVVRDLLDAGAAVGAARRAARERGGGLVETCSCEKPEPTAYGVCKACGRKR